MSKSFRAWLAVLAILFSGSVLAYPLVTIKNNSEYTATGTVYYADLDFLGVSLCSDDSYSVGPGKTWTASSRGECLVTDITGSLAGPPKNGEDINVVQYRSSGTGYAQFRLEAYGGSYRIFSESEWAKESDTTVDKSPGFYFINKTDWPIAFSLDQAGCLYHGIVPKGGSIKRNTGAAWFTLRMHIQPDGVNPQTDWDCAEPIISIVTDVAIGALTGGAGAPAAAALKVVAKAAVKSAVKAAIKSATKNVFKQMISDMIDLSGRVEMWGQFSGYEWPFRCSSMPTYEITNGPGVTKNSLGDIFLFGGPALKVTKINTCGNDMMLGSPKTASAIQPFDPPAELIESLDPAPPEPVPADLLAQRAALQALYNSTNGGQWFRNTGWLLGEGTECTWYGVYCNALGRVTSINLANNNLEGGLPAQIGDLSNLQYLNLGANKLSGTLPSSLGNLTALNYLNLSKNLFSNSLPTTLGNLVNLTELLLSDNGFTGAIPTQLGNLVNLRKLTLANNQFTGTVPQVILDLNIPELTFDSALAPLSAAVGQDDGGFKFSFGNATGNVGGAISGIVMGLVDNQRDQQATSIILTSWPGGLAGVAPTREVTQWTSQLSNRFDVIDGEIVSATFAAQNSGTTFSTFVLNAGLITNCCDVADNGLSFDNNNTIVANRGGYDAVRFGLLLPPIKLSFSNVQGNVAGTVTAIVRGLANDWNGQAATSIELVSWPSGLLGTVPAELDVLKWTGSPGTYVNNFNVADGLVSGAQIASIVPGRAFMVDQTISTGCCGNINNVLSWDSGATATGVIAGTAGINLDPILPPFRFSFDNVQGNVPGTVSGIIRGLVDNQSGQAATAIELLSWPAGLVGTVPAELDVTNWSGVYSNSFDVVDGQIVAANVGIQEPGRAFYINRTLSTNCCGNINNLLTFDSAHHVTGVIAGFPGVNYARMSEPLKFTFKNLEGNVQGSVSGIIRGLAAHRSGQAAQSVLITNWPDGLEGNTDVDLDATTWTIAAYNSFDLVNGRVVGAKFSGQQPGRALYMNSIINSNCCGRLSNLLTFNSGGTSTGSTLGYDGISIAPLLSTATLPYSTYGRVLPDIERQALIAFYQATGGESWLNNTGWLEPGGSECEWFGVICTNDRVTGLELSANRLTGSIPWRLDELPLLQILNLEHNELTGAIPWELGTLSQLRVLNLQNNQLAGWLPQELSWLNQLEILNLRNNDLEGSIPEAFGNLTALRELWLDGNMMSGPLPDIFSGFDQLRILTLRNNEFSGILPPSLLGIAVPYLNFDQSQTPPDVIFSGSFELAELLHRWSFNTDANDSIGGAHATLVNGASIGGGSVSLDGVDQYIELPIPLTLSSLKSMTFEFWMTLDDTPYWSRIFDFGTGTTVNFFASPRGGANLVRAAITTGGNPGEERVEGLSDLPVGVPVHFALSLNADTDTVVMYVNGQPVGNSTWTMTPEDLGLLTNIWLGRSQYESDAFLDGVFDEVRIYGEALTDDQVSDSYIAGPNGL